MFGGKDRDSNDGLELSAEVDRAGELPLAQLAIEVMIKGFGPDGPGGPGKPGTIEAPALDGPRVDLNAVAAAFTPAFTSRGATRELQLRLTMLLAEGLQLLEHSGLIRITWRGGIENYHATRRGRGAVEHNTLEEFIALP